MTRDELTDRLKKYEWSDVEFKEAARAAPRDSYTTVSAFANTSGGWLVFGVRDRGGSFEIVGVIEVDKVQNEFLSTLRSGQKVNRSIDVSGEIIETGGETLLVFHVPESPRSEKPVYLDGDIRRSFIRRGGCDERCTPAEIERFLRDASDTSYDGRLLEALDAGEFFDPASMRWYRRAFDERNPGRDQTLSDLEFLHEWGFVVEHGERLVPTRAAVLVLGRPRHVRRILPRLVVDFQIIDSAFDSWSPDHRWSDRIEVEENLIQAWLRLSERYMKLAERPFSVNTATLRRDDDPPDYISFREAAINLLLHQDYGDHGRKASVRIFRDRILFWNPGDSFATADELLDPTEKEVRNPSIVAAFRRIGLSEQAGTGVRAIFRNWQRLGHVPPVIDNNKGKKSFTLRLEREELLGEEQRLFQAQLGARLDDAQARLFAFACRHGGASLTDAKAVTGRSGPEARRILDTLVVQGLLLSLSEGQRYGLAEHLVDARLDSAQLGQSASDQVAEGSGSLVTDQPGSPAGDSVTPLLTNLTDNQRKLIQLCEVARKQADLMRELGFTHRTFFRRAHLEPLIRAGLIQMTHPEEPNHPDQAYVVTEAGSGLLDAWQTASGGVTTETKPSARSQAMNTMEQQYIAQMEEIKRRIESIEKIVEISTGQLYLPVVTESIYLQFRKILEIIAMSSLVANGEAMEEMGRSLKKLGNQWNGHDILRLVEAINPDFYPEPIIEKESQYPDEKSELENKKTGFLTKELFSELYNRKCASLLHADNPFGKKTNYRDLWKEGSIWKRRIMELLNSHTIRLVGQDGFYLVHIHEARDGQVHMYEFKRVDR